MMLQCKLISCFFVVVVLCVVVIVFVCVFLFCFVCVCVCEGIVCLEPSVLISKFDMFN